MQKAINWFFMLNKRLYKKVSFIIILLLIPVAVISLSVISKQDSGFVHIILTQHNENDALSTQIIDELLAEDSLVRFTKVKTEKDAIEMIKNSAADEAWIFHDNLNQKISDFAKPESGYSPAVTVICREKNVLLALTNEKLTSAMYKHCAKTYYLNFIRQNVSEFDMLSDDELYTYFDNHPVNEDIFVFRTSGGKLEEAPQNNYLVSPIRGLLGIITVISGMAAALFYMQDKKRGTFSWIPEHKQLFVAFFCILIATFNVTLVSFISLLCAKIVNVSLTEIACIILYALCASAFCLLLLQVFSNIKIYSAIIPLVCVVMVAVCPVFFDLRSIFTLQHLLPPTYYVNSTVSSIYLLYMLIYTVAVITLCYIIDKIKNNIALTKINIKA